MDIMTPEEIRAQRPDPCPDAGDSAMARARRAMASAGCAGANQQMGQRWPIGCVALEITQRCNLDCTLCYLSEHSESVVDLPLAEVFRRIDLIRRHYGPETDVQITGGDPTLRRRKELLAIVARVRDRGMRPTLMTNGKKATRALLAELVAAGLVDVAFHVDTTQQRKGHATEEALNAVRIRYMERARGLGLSVMFNTTVHRGNFHEIPMLAAFFRRHAREVRTVSFQLQADTGRGVLGARDSVISPETVAACIQEGAGVALNFNASRVGHPGCNRYAMGLEVNGRLYNLFDDPQALGRLQQATAGLILDRRRPMRVLVAVASWLFRHPRFAMPVARLGIRKLLEMSSDLFAARGQVHTLSFLIHNFMDACALDRERIEACVFKTMTRDGPMSMCLHNARRDEFILQPVPMNPAQGLGYWQPLTGEMGDEETAPLELDPDRYAFKRLKGRARVRFQRDPSRGSGRRLAG